VRFVSLFLTRYAVYQRIHIYTGAYRSKHQVIAGFKAISGHLAFFHQVIKGWQSSYRTVAEPRNRKRHYIFGWLGRAEGLIQTSHHRLIHFLVGLVYQQHIHVFYVEAGFVHAFFGY